MPPAFILSQNQTLKFNCLKSLLAKSNNGSNYFLLSLCWLAFKVTLFKYFEKINGNYLSFAYCQIKSHFFLIPFLIFLKQATACTAWLPPRQLVYNTTTLFPLSTIFLHFFKVFLKNFSTIFFRSPALTACLSYHIFYPLSTIFLRLFESFSIFHIFYSFLRKLFSVFNFSRLDFIRARVIQYIIYL